jgi:hypothetical protein
MEVVPLGFTHSRTVSLFCWLVWAAVSADLGTIRARIDIETKRL